MRVRLAVCVVAVAVLVVAGAVAVTAVRARAEHAAAAATAAVSLARETASTPTVTVPPLSAPMAISTAELEADAAASAAAAAGSAAAAAALSSASKVSASRSAAAASISSAAASSSAASASSAAAARAAASRLAASRSAASQAAASSAAAASAAASRAAVSSSAAASSAAAAAAGKAAAANASAAAHPAPDTSEAVEAAAEEAAEDGITQSVIVMNKQTGSVTTSIDADRDVPAMSLFKVIIAADVIDRAGGVANVDPGTLDHLRQMIVASDDSIAQGFYDDDGQGAIVTRVANTYGLSGTRPSPEPRYWGDVQITARDMASLLYQLLSDDDDGTSAWFTEAMEGSLDTGADGFDQNFGVNAVPGAGSKQGWGCCLGSVVAIHSMGFTANQIIVVLSTADNDVSYKKLGTAAQLAADPGAQASVAAVTRTVEAALPPS